MAVISASVGQGGKNQRDDVKAVQTLLGRHAAWLDGQAPPAATGQADAGTVRAIKTFQTNAAALLKADGVVSPHGFTIRQMSRASIPKPGHRIFTQACWFHPPGGLTQADFDAAAKTLACPAAAIQAVAQTETKRAAWESLGRPTILFERHYFSRLSRHAYNRSHPDISNPVAGGYGLFSAQFPKLHRAAVLDEDAALQSASWGSFQIMGANYAQAGFSGVGAFVDAMMTSEKKHLDAFVAFISDDAAMLKALQTQDWPTFARHYNGANYQQNDYDVKMADAYAALSPPAPAKPRVPQAAR